MALKITSPIHTFQGIILNESYARVEVKDGQTGTIIEASVSIYPSKEAFQAGAQPLGVKKNADYTMLYPLDTYITVTYNRAVDGPDILSLAHQAFVQHLAGYGITAVIQLD